MPRSMRLLSLSLFVVGSVVLGHAADVVMTPRVNHFAFQDPDGYWLEINDAKE